MIKLAIVSSKKYLKSKQAVALISYLDEQKIYYEKILVDSEIENIQSEKDVDLIIILLLILIQIIKISI